LKENLKLQQDKPDSPGDKWFSFLEELTVIMVKSTVGFRLTVTPPVWQISSREEPHCITLHISEYIIKCNFERAYILRLSYFGDLTTKNSYKPGCLETPCHRVQVRDHHRYSLREVKGQMPTH
jgi:hypothetical protein